MTILERLNATIDSNPNETMIEIRMNAQNIDELMGEFERAPATEVYSAAEAPPGDAPAGWVARYRDVWIVRDDTVGNPIPTVRPHWV